MTKIIDVRFIVFSLVGIFNTLLDIVIYLVAYNAMHSILWANLVATSAAMIGSYTLNSRLTFKAKHWTVKNFTLFVGVTVLGLWVLQTGLIYCFAHVMHLVPRHDWRVLGSLDSTVMTLVPKLLATCFTFLWNFVWYNKVIFRNAQQGEAVEELALSS